jgi:hypothetical protein
MHALSTSSAVIDNVHLQGLKVGDVVFFQKDGSSGVCRVEGKYILETANEWRFCVCMVHTLTAKDRGARQGTV